MATANKARPAEPPQHALGQAKKKKRRKENAESRLIQFFVCSSERLTLPLSGGRDGGMFSSIFQEVMKSSSPDRCVMTLSSPDDESSACRSVRKPHTHLSAFSQKDRCRCSYDAQTHTHTHALSIVSILASTSPRPPSSHSLQSHHNKSLLLDITPWT